MKTMLDAYRSELEGCRFCPMCKPAAEVANLTQFESHTTRARAIFLWRETRSHALLTDRETELLYESTLDGISESWCVSHYRVSEYTRTARRVLVERDQIPDAVRAVLHAPTYEPDVVPGDAVLFLDVPSVRRLPTAPPGDHPAETSTEKDAPPLPPVWTADSGVSLYWLGADTRAKERLSRTVAMISGSATIVTAGAVEQFALTRMAAELGIEVPSSVEIVPLALWLSRHSGLRARYEPTAAFFHDARAAMKLCQELATDAAIQPSFDGPEQALGTGEVYEAPRRLLESAGYSLTFVRWQRSLSRSSGADDALDLIHPNLSEDLANARIRYLADHGVRTVVTDSVATRDLLRQSAAHLEPGITVAWLPDAFVAT